MTTLTTTSAPRRSDATHGSRRLDHEWQHLRTRAGALRTARSWVDCGGRLGALVSGIDDLQVIVDATQRGRPGADDLLLQLVDCAGTQQLAGRIVLQRLLRPLVAAAARHLHHEPDAVEVALTSAWISIRRYDTGRRRRHVAPGLVSDTIDRALRQPHRRRAGTELPMTHGWLDHVEATRHDDPLVEVADVLVEARRCGVDAVHLDLVAGLVRSGSTAALAASCGVTPRTIRNRRHHAVTTIRDAIAAA